METHPKVIDDYNFLKHDYTKNWRDIFPDFGMCMTKLYDSNGYIPIPRCGSQYWLDFTEKQLNWHAEHITSIDGYYETMKQWKPELAVEKKFFAILRDPYERYISALFAIYKTLDESILPAVYENPSLDDHHLILQKHYFYGFDLNKITFFNINDIDFDKKISYYITHVLGYKADFHISWRQSERKENIKNLLENDDKLSDKIHQYLQDDYEFLETIKFYNYE